jgi:Domain of unknown function (DUF6265)
MRKVFFSIGLIFIFHNLSFAQQSTQFKWMLGVWKLNVGSGVIVEEWKIANDSTLTGKSSFVKNGTDTVPQETIELAYRNGDWYYSPIVKNQNNGQPVPFKIILLKGTEFISENPTHDFPQRIAYRRIKNQLFASIEGKRNGKYGKQNFDFVTE